MKTIGIVLLLTAVVAGTIQYYVISKPEIMSSNEAAIFSYITRPKEYPLGVDVHTIETEACAFTIDSIFRAFSASSTRSADEARMGTIKGALMQEQGFPSWQELDVNQLITPSASAKIAQLRTHVRKGCEQRGQAYSLTFSSACLAKNGKALYYVEQIYQGDKKGRGTIYVIENQKVQQKIDVWIN